MTHKFSEFVSRRPPRCIPVGGLQSPATLTAPSLALPNPSAWFVPFVVFRRESRDTGNEVLAEASLTQVSGSDIVRGRLCQYLREWTALKIRWSLTVDRAEKRALVRRAAGCRNVVVTVRKAKVRARA